jgi:hypothetical protein
VFASADSKFAYSQSGAGSSGIRCRFGPPRLSIRIKTIVAEVKQASLVDLPGCLRREQGAYAILNPFSVLFEVRILAKCGR